jgi:alpha-glucosidase
LIQSKPVLEYMPVWVRGGAIIAEEPLVQSTDEKPEGPLELQVYPGADCHGSLYQDDGHTFAYQRGEILRMEFACQVAGPNLTITSRAVKTTYQPWWSSARITVYSGFTAPKEVRIGNEKIRDWSYDSKSGAVAFTVVDALKSWNAQIVY